MKMILHCAICDDLPEAVEAAKARAEKVFKEKNIAYEISTYTNSNQLLFDFDESRQLDLLILDIEMPGATGLEIAAMAKKVYKNCIIVFLTSYLNYAIDGYELEIFRFVPKDDENRLERAIGDAVKIINLESRKSYFVKRYDWCGKIPYKDILYISKNGKNSVIHMENEDPVKIRKPISVVFSELNSEEFIFIDRGCIANMMNVMRVDKNNWICKNGEKLAISRSSYSEIKKKLLEFWGRKMFDD